VLQYYSNLKGFFKGERLVLLEGLATVPRKAKAYPVFMWKFKTNKTGFSASRNHVTSKEYAQIMLQNYLASITKAVVFSLFQTLYNYFMAIHSIIWVPLSLKEKYSHIIANQPLII